MLGVGGFDKFAWLSFNSSVVDSEVEEERRREGERRREKEREGERELLCVGCWLI